MAKYVKNKDVLRDGESPEKRSLKDRITNVTNITDITDIVDDLFITEELPTTVYMLILSIILIFSLSISWLGWSCVLTKVMIFSFSAVVISFFIGDVVSTNYDKIKKLFKK